MGNKYKQHILQTMKTVLEEMLNNNDKHFEVAFTVNDDNSMLIQIDSDSKLYGAEFKSKEDK